MEEFSMLDAFKALKDVSDDIIYNTPKKTGKIGSSKKVDKTLNEAITVDLNSDISSEEADKAVEEATAKVDRPITIVDVNADTLEHVKDNVEYVGQVILKCKKCQGLKFIDMDKLVSAEIDDPDHEGEKIEVYNLEDECPVCHAENSGFDIVGQVSRVPEEKPAEENPEQALNDEAPTEETETAEQEEDKTEEPTADNDNQEEEAQEESEPAADTEDDFKVDDTLEDDIETDFMETDAEDDTEEDEVAEEKDEDEVEEDDTETNESLEDGKLRGLLNGLNESDGEVKAEEEEVFEYEKPLVIDDSEASTVADYVDENSNKCENCQKLADLFSYIVEPDDIEACEIYSQDEEPKLLYQGTCKEIPASFKENAISKFGTNGALLLINVGDEVEEGTKLSDILKLYDDKEDEVVCVTDQESGEELSCGKRDDIIDQYGNRSFISVEAPKVLALYVQPEEGVEAITTEVTPKDELLKDIFDANNLSKYNINDKRTVESWINEALDEKENDDLTSIYSSFIRPTRNKKLIEEFKAFTGYKDALDIVKEEFSDLLVDEAVNADAPGILKMKKMIKDVKEEKQPEEAEEQPLDEEAEPAGIKKLKRMFTLNIQNESVEEDLDMDGPVNGDGAVIAAENTNEALDNFVDRTMKKINQAIDGDDIEDILSDIELAFKSESIGEDEFELLQTKAHEKMDSLLESAIAEANKQSINEEKEPEVELPGIKELDFIRDLAYNSVTDGEVIYSFENFANALSDEGLEATEDLFNTYQEFVANQQLAESKRVDEAVEDEQARLNDCKKEVEKWAEDDLESNSVMASMDEFTAFCLEAGFDPTYFDELYDVYLEKVGYVEEALTEDLNEEVEEQYKLDGLDKIQIKINGEVASEGTVKELFKDEQALNDFYKSFSYVDGKYVAQEGNEEWVIEVVEKANREEANEQLAKETNPEKKAELEAEKAEAEKDMEYCDDHNNPAGAISAAKEIDRINEDTSEVCSECGKPCNECTCVKEEVISFKTRRELGEAIENCKAKNQHYKVARSTNEDYRYDLTILHEAEEKWEGDFVENPDDYKADDLMNQADEYEKIQASIEELNKELESEEVQAAIDAAEAESGIPEESDAPEEAVCPVCGKVGEECTCVDFDSDTFDDEINAYFEEAYEEPMLYTTEKGSVDANGNIMLEGLLKSENTSLKVNFLLTPDKALTEGIDIKDINYKVTNNLSDETFEFNFKK